MLDGGQMTERRIVVGRTFDTPGTRHPDATGSQARFFGSPRGNYVPSAPRFCRLTPVFRLTPAFKPPVQAVISKLLIPDRAGHTKGFARMSANCLFHLLA